MHRVDQFIPELTVTDPLHSISTSESLALRKCTGWNLQVTGDARRNGCVYYPPG